MDKLIHKGTHKDIWQVVKNLYKGLTSKVKWLGECRESFPIKQGVKQGGMFSTHLYKVFIDGFFLTYLKTNDWDSELELFISVTLRVVMMWLF